MALDEFLFGKAVRFWKRRLQKAAVLERTVLLDTERNRLMVVARAVTGDNIDLFPAIREGGFKGDVFFLPERFSFFPTAAQNRDFFLFRTLYLCLQRQLQYNAYDYPNIGDADAYRLAGDASPDILDALFELFPALHNIYDAMRGTCNPESGEQLDTTWIFGRFMADQPPAAKAQARMPGADGKLTGLPQASTTLQAKPVEEIIVLDIDQKQQEDYVLTHNFEKVETADEFNGVWRDFDGDDSLGEHADALQELDMKFVVRTDDPVHSVYQAAYAENASVGESAERIDAGPCICYDEWDYAKKDYRRQYAKLYPYRHTGKDHAYLAETLDQHRTVLAQLRKLLASLHNKWQQQRLQQQGKEVDIDMAVDRYADIHAGHTPSEKIYISDRKHARDLSILILMDLSLSSDSYAAGNRVIDVEKQTCILFGEILQEYGIDFSVAGFYSRTRNHTAYVTIKDFEESWITCRDRLGSLKPEGYTRIGSALRHSGTLLAQRDSGNPWLILLSDGKPNDFDRYEGRYGVQDIRQALRELHANRIQTYALAIEATARHYLPQMFGQDHFQIVSSPAALLTALIRLFERIRHGS